VGSVEGKRSFKRKMGFKGAMNEGCVRKVENEDDGACEGEGRGRAGGEGSFCFLFGKSCNKSNIL